MRGLGVSHPNDLTSGLNGGPLGGSPQNEFPLGESPCCNPSYGW
jgi:hypothetical protein